MVRDGGSDPLVVPTRWDLLGVALGRVPVRPCGTGAGFMDRRARRSLYVTDENFYQMDKAWIRNWSQSHLQNMEV